MKKLLLIACILPLIAQAQINKGNWLIGGAIGGNYAQSEEYINGGMQETTLSSLNAITQVAYFPIKKLAVGLNTQFTANNQKITVSNSFPSSFTQTFEIKDQIVAIGPMLRYYLLSSEQKFNFYLQGSFQSGSVNRQGLSIIDPFSPIEQEKKGLMAYHLSAAPVYMLNNKVSIELMLTYSRVEHFDVTNRFSGAIGLQVHLGK